MSFKATFRYEGDALEYTPSVDTPAGSVVLIGGTVPGITVRDIVALTKGSAVVEGVFDVVKATGAINGGDPVFWDATGDPVGGVAGTGAAKSSGTVQLGFAVLAALSGDATVRVKLTSALVNSSTLGGSVTANDITGGDAALNITGKVGAASVGGDVIIAAGAGNGGSNAGGATTIRGGLHAGVGADGALIIGDQNTSAVSLGTSGVPTNISGPLAFAVAASTAAAGTTTADAGALPGNTNALLPTTAADGTKGVKIHTLSKVTGNTLLIGNGVSNQILKVYPPAGGTINGAAADAAYSGGSGKGVICTCLNAGANTWFAWG